MLPFLAFFALGLAAAAAEDASCATNDASCAANTADLSETGLLGTDAQVDVGIEDVKQADASFQLQTGALSKQVFEHTQDDEMSCDSLESKYADCTADDVGKKEGCNPSDVELAFHAANCDEDSSLASIAEAKKKQAQDDLLEEDDLVNDGAGWWGRRRRRSVEWPRECCLCANNFMRPHGFCNEPGFGWLAHVNAYPDCDTCAATIQTRGTYDAGDCPDDLVCSSDTTPGNAAGTYQLDTSGEGDCSDATVIKTKQECANAIRQLWGLSNVRIQEWSSNSYAAGCIRASGAFVWNNNFWSDWQHDTGKCVPTYAECACKASGSSLVELSAVNDTKKAATKVEAQMLEQSIVRKSNEC